MLRIPLPVLYLAEDDQERLVVVDGLQRLTTFQRFVNNELRLRLEDRPELHDNKFEDLTPKLAKSRRGLQSDPVRHGLESSRTSSVGHLRACERRVPLSRQQMRNCLYMGEATKFLKEESRSDVFLRSIGRSLKTSMMRDREFVNRFCAFQTLGAEKYRDMDEFLADGLREMNSKPESLPALSSQFRDPRSKTTTVCSGGMRFEDVTLHWTDAMCSMLRSGMSCLRAFRTIRQKL